MNTRKRTEITIETNRVLVISKRKISILTWCAECKERVEMVTADEAATLAGVSSRTIYRWADVEKLHFTETSEGRLIICCASIPPPGLIAG